MAFDIGDRVKAALRLSYGEPPKVIKKGTRGVVTNEWEFDSTAFYSVRFNNDTRDRLADDDSLERDTGN